ncbi:MAG: DUF1080 domain-containing protein [Opitutaceae bacterium]|jgi:hypothetical protein|nr:DUF1080 domain-containing protein [Opitutaceae bacterium]
MHTRTRTRILTHALAAAALLALHAALAPATATAAAHKPDKPIELFNGKNLDGWLGCLQPKGNETAATWNVADGILHVTGQPNGYLYTAKSYRDYKLTVEWRWSGPAPLGRDGKPRLRNNGVLLHMQSDDDARLGVWPRSLEAQLQENNAGDFFVIAGVETAELRALRDKALAAAGNDEKARKNALNNRRIQKARDSSEKPVGEWNRYEITCRADTVVLKVNGTEQNRATGLNVTEGRICLQTEGSAIQFRNVRLEPL